MHPVKTSPGVKNIAGHRLRATIRQPPVEAGEDAMLKGDLEQIIPIRHPGQGHAESGISILRLGETVVQDLILGPGLGISFWGAGHLPSTMG